MDSILSVPKKDITGDDQEFTNVSRAVSQAKSYLYRQFIGIWQIPWRCNMESSNFDTSSIRNKWHCWKSRSTSEGRDFSSVATIRIGWKMVGWFDGMLLPSAKCPRRPGRRENSVWNTIRRTIQRTNNSFFEQWLNITWFQHEINQDFINLARTLCQESILGMHWSRWSLDRRHFVADIEELEKMGASENFPRRIDAKGVLTSQKGEEFMFPIADGAAKLSGRDYEFREPTLRREQAVRSEDLSGELQGELGEPQPTESKDDAEARPDFWSIQGDFICRYHNEPRVLQLHMPKEETFPFPMKYIDVTRSTHRDLDVMQEQCIDDYWNVDSNRSLSDSCRGSQNSLHWKKHIPSDFCGLGGDCQKFKRLRDQIMYGLKYWAKLGKQLRVENNKNGKTRSQNSTMLDDWENLLYWSGWRRYTETLQNTRKKLVMPMGTAMPCKKEIILVPGNWLRRWLHLTRFQRPSMVVLWIPTNPQGNEWNLLGLKKHEDHIAGKGFTWWPITIWFTSLFLGHKRWKYRMQKQQRTRNGKSSKQSQHGRLIPRVFQKLWGRGSCRCLRQCRFVLPFRAWPSLGGECLRGCEFGSLLRAWSGGSGFRCCWRRPVADMYRPGCLVRHAFIVVFVSVSGAFPSRICGTYRTRHNAARTDCPHIHFAQEDTAKQDEEEFRREADRAMDL